MESLYEKQEDTHCEARYACGTFKKVKDGETICSNDSKCSHVYDYGCRQEMFCLCPKGARIVKSKWKSCLYTK